MNTQSRTGLPRVTYSNINEDFSGVHAVLDEVIPEVKAQLGKSVPNFINGEDSTEGTAYEAPCPVDRTISLGTFYEASPDAVGSAIAAARAAFPAWKATTWQDRVEIGRRAADLIAERKYEIAATCLLEVGKSRMEAIGEVEETVDIIRFYCSELERNKGYRLDLERASAAEETVDVLRPYGAFAVIAPFNFPVALSIGMSVSALLAANTVVFKPSPMAGLTGRLITDCFVDAGVPVGVFNLVNGGQKTGAALAGGNVDGIAFTGSHAVGMSLMREFGVNGPYFRPVLAEMGGKNPTYVCASADLDVAASGLLRSAFGLQGQKCSASSVAFVHEEIADAFVEKLTAAAAAVKIGDPYEQDTFMGPVINESAYARFTWAVGQARADGGTVHGGETLKGGIYENGYFVQPAIATGLSDDHPLHKDELFLPFVTIRTFSDLGTALAEGNDITYGLTAGIYTRQDDELDQFLTTAEAGALYANRASGATTGAWPGIQTFCGWKGSGTGSKGGLGTWYLPQFMREQSHTIMRDG